MAKRKRGFLFYVTQDMTQMHFWIFFIFLTFAVHKISYLKFIAVFSCVGWMKSCRYTVLYIADMSAGKNVWLVNLLKVSTDSKID